MMPSEGFANRLGSDARQRIAAANAPGNLRPKAQPLESLSLVNRENPPVEGWVFVASEGFEPPKAEPADLQSDPFGRLGN